MTNMKKYLKSQCRVCMFKLEPDSPDDFYLCCWQNNGASSLPCLCITLVLFLISAAILVASLMMMGSQWNLGYWFIYLTHWEIMLVVFTTGFGTAVAFRAYFKGPISEYIFIINKFNP